ncbi:hypothetical protein AVEN_221970-1 [Araneus ventricosus]|uniref:Uncharacterized protein n=1 Tax=Araneus ventricosus TaxID=182803 RepID=A0A4Y2F8A7_ARAVE|nr:hypothetical protein AVEN_221970-1 [Araneus ventricosus]
MRLRKKSVLHLLQLSEMSLCRRKAENYVELVNEMLNSFKYLGCNRNIKVHYLHSHRFSESLRDTSEEQGGRFHQDIKTMEDHYQGIWDTHMTVGYCWGLKRDCSKNHSRMLRKRSFRSAQ